MPPTELGETAEHAEDKEGLNPVSEDAVRNG